MEMIVMYVMLSGEVWRYLTVELVVRQLEQVVSSVVIAEAEERVAQRYRSISGSVGRVGPVYCLSVEFYLWRRRGRPDGLCADTWCPDQYLSGGRVVRSQL